MKLRKWVSGKGVDLENIEKILDDDFMEGKGFWIFFLDRNIQVPEKAWVIRQFSACAINIYGNARYLRDIRTDREEKEKAMTGLAQWVENCGKPGPSQS